MTKTVFNVAAIVILFACASVSAVLQRKIATLKEGKVYFCHDPGEYIDLAPVMRSVNAAAPARPAIEALLKGPTTVEKQKGFDSLMKPGDFRIGSLKISSGTAHINFIFNAALARMARRPRSRQIQNRRRVNSKAIPIRATSDRFPQRRPEVL